VVAAATKQDSVMQAQPLAQATSFKRQIAPANAELPAISIIGLGYVGVVSVGCLSARGFNVVGVDIDTNKVANVASGRSPIIERGLDELLAKGKLEGLISATRDLADAILTTDVTLMAVGTPTSPDGGCDMTYLRAASRSIGEALARKTSYHCVILRCSVPPGTTLGVVVPEIEAASGKTAGVDFGICFCPEFLREGTAVADFADPPKTVIAPSDPRAEAIARQVIANPGQKVLIASIAAAEALKYADNIWHATKVVFANEIGRLCKSMDVDSHEVMSLFVEDTKLNLSPYYLKPGFAFGGSCLPKEVRAAVHISARDGISLPLVDSLLHSNECQIAEAHRLVAAHTGKTIGLLGVTFKPGTDDLRESPMVELLARLLRDGETVRVYDPNVRAGKSLSAQLRAIRAAHLDLAPAIDALEKGDIVVGLDEVMEGCDVVIAAHSTAPIRDAVKARGAHVQVIDLVRLYPEIPAEKTYQGIGW
jgi:GDP-mannose 6-dehydrogenase